MKASVTTLVASEEAYDLLSAVAGNQTNIERYYGPRVLPVGVDVSTS